MRMKPYDAWAFARLLGGHTPGPDLSRISRAFAPLAAQLERVEVVPRLSLWCAVLAVVECDRDELIEDVSAADPASPAPFTEPIGQPANLGDVRRAMAEREASQLRAEGGDH